MASWIERLKAGLAKTAKLLDVRSWLGRTVDQTFLDRLEAQLLQADVGVKATERVLQKVKDEFEGKTADEELLRFVKTELVNLLTPVGGAPEAIRYAAEPPTTLLIAGVNGSGKTTSIAKLTHRIRSEGKSLVLAACDTFRAAAADQLAIWAERTGADLVRGQAGADPASVAHDACDRALARKADVLMVDTAGRLHTQTHLMRELEKIRNVLQRKIPNAPHEVFLVLDGTSGQNAIRQAEMFSKSIGCTGVILTKLDGTAKGGAAVAIRQTLDLPVRFIGVGEGVDDLQPFRAEEFVASLFGEQLVAGSQ